MNADTYQKLALTLRFVFSLAGVGVAVLAFNMLLRDARNARLLRAREAETGRLAIIECRSGKYNLLREGTVGSGRACDVVIKGEKLERRHFYYELVNGNLIIHPLEGSLKRSGKPRPEDGESMALCSGEGFMAGQAAMRFLLIKAYGETASPLNRFARGE